jgi:hypothetical protein
MRAGNRQTAIPSTLELPCAVRLQICIMSLFGRTGADTGQALCDLSRGLALSFDQEENLTYDIHPNRVFSFVHKLVTKMQ